MRAYAEDALNHEFRRRDHSPPTGGRRRPVHCSTFEWGGVKMRGDMSDQTIARTIKGFCAAYGVGQTTTYDLIKRGILETRKAGMRTLITEASARAWFEGLSAYSPAYRRPPNAGNGRRRSAKDKTENSQQFRRNLKAGEGQRRV